MSDILAEYWKWEIILPTVAELIDDDLEPVLSL